MTLSTLSTTTTTAAAAASAAASAAAAPKTAPPSSPTTHSKSVAITRRAPREQAAALHSPTPAMRELCDV